MQWPWVSKRYAEFLEASLKRAIAERDEQQSRADRLADQLIDRMGFVPVSAPVRAEMKQAEEEFKKYTDASQFEDVGAGMISEEILKIAEDLGEKPEN